MMDTKRKTVRIDVKATLVETKNYEQINKPDRDNPPEWLRAMREPPTIELPKSVDKKQTIAQRVVALSKRSNGNRPMVMTSHMVNHKPVRKRAKTPYEKHVFSHTYDNLDDRSYDEAVGPRGKQKSSGFYCAQESERIRDGKTRFQVNGTKVYWGEESGGGE